MAAFDAERHAITLAANAIRWTLAEGDWVAAHPGLRGHLIAADCQLAACGLLLALPAAEVEPPC